MKSGREPWWPAARKLLNRLFQVGRQPAFHTTEKLDVLRQITVLFHERNVLPSPAPFGGCPSDALIGSEIQHGYPELPQIVAKVSLHPFACFDDTGLAEARKLSGVPTIGIGEAAFHAAMLLGTKFSVVTTLSVSVPVIEENLKDYGLDSMCLKVRASDVPVLDLEIPGSDAQDKISKEISRSLSDEKPGAVVLGCAGMADLAAQFSQTHKVPVIDGVVAAVGLASGLVGASSPLCGTLHARHRDCSSRSSPHFRVRGR